MKPPLLHAILPPLLFTISALAQDATPAEKIAPRDITATLLPDKAAVMPGEPFYVSLIIKNNSTRDLILWVSDDFTRDTGPWRAWVKSREITLTATSKEGAKLPEFDWVKSKGMNWGQSETHSPERVPASGNYTFRVLVPKWVVFDQPGTYTLTAAAKLVFSLAPAAGDNAAAKKLLIEPTMIYIQPLSSITNRPAVVEADKSAVAIPVSATAAIEVAPPDQKKMDDLTDALLKNPPSGETIAKLLAIPDERAIPWLLREFKENSPDPKNNSQKYDSAKDAMRLDALHALSKFNNDAALDALKSGMEPADTYSGDTVYRERSTVIHYLLQSPHPGALSYILSCYNFPDQSVRYEVVRALSNKVPPVQAIPVLQKMTTDKDEQIRNESAFILKKLQANPTP